MLKNIRKCAWVCVQLCEYVCLCVFISSRHYLWWLVNLLYRKYTLTKHLVTVACQVIFNDKCDNHSSLSIFYSYCGCVQKLLCPFSTLARACRTRTQLMTYILMFLWMSARMWTNYIQIGIHHNTKAYASILRLEHKYLTPLWLHHFI